MGKGRTRPYGWAVVVVTVGPGTTGPAAVPAETEESEGELG